MILFRWHERCKTGKNFLICHMIEISKVALEP